MSVAETLRIALVSAVAEGNFGVALLSTDKGLPLVAVGRDAMETERLAALTAVFDEVAIRVHRDLSMDGLDELTLRHGASERLVVRPVALDGEARVFLVVTVPRRRPWRRVTNSLMSEIQHQLRGSPLQF